MVATSFSYSGTELDALTEAGNYYRRILSYFEPHICGSVVEIGAGIGTFSAFLLNGTRLRKITLIEPAGNLFPRLQHRFAGDPRVELRKGYLDDFAASLRADAVVAVNVLEHAERDVEFLRSVHDILEPGGAALLFTAALPFLYGTLDESFEHYRRYTKRELRAKMERAGLEVQQLRYFSLPGVVLWFLAGRVLRRRTIRPEEASFYDRRVVPWISRIERTWEPPLGQSLLAVGKRRGP